MVGTPFAAYPASMQRMFRAGMLIAATAGLLAAAAPAPVGSVAGAQSAAEEIENAVGLSRTRVLVRFAAPVTGRSLAPADFTLTMGGDPRSVSRVDVAADGRSAEVEAAPAWPYGTAGAIRLRTAEKAVRVWASPGDVTRPVLTGVRLANRTICIKGLSRNCAASGGTVNYVLDEAAAIVLDLRRRSTDAPSLMRVTRGEGPGSVRFREKIEGRRLRPGSFRLTIYAVDVAGNESRPVTLSLRVRR
jgi:hypothetical protein